MKNNRPTNKLTIDEYERYDINDLLKLLKQSKKNKADSFYVRREKENNRVYTIVTYAYEA